MGDDKSVTVSVNEAAKIVGLSRSAFYYWRKRNQINPVPGSSTKRPRYWRTDIERAAKGKPVERATLEELQRRALEADNYAERGLEWPPRS